MTPQNEKTIKDTLETIQKILKQYQDDYIKKYLIIYKLYPTYEDSYVKYNYSYNYLNLPKITKI